MSCSRHLQAISKLFILFFLLNSCASYTHFVGQKEQNISLATGPNDHEHSAYQEADKIIAPYRVSLESEMGKVIGNSAIRLSKGFPEGSLGNWMADAMYDRALEVYDDIDLAMINSGSIRIPSIEEGPITTGLIFELMPFDNYMVMLELSGNDMLRLFNHAASKKGWPVSRNIKYKIVGDKAKEVTLDGLSIDKNRTYRIVTSHYLADGGDRCDFLKNYEQHNSALFIRDIYLQAVKRKYAMGQSVDGNFIGRVYKQNSDE